MQILILWSILLDLFSKLNYSLLSICFYNNRETCVNNIHNLSYENSSKIHIQCKTPFERHAINYLNKQRIWIAVVDLPSDRQPIDAFKFLMDRSGVEILSKKNKAKIKKQKNKNKTENKTTTITKNETKHQISIHNTSTHSIIFK